MTKRHLAEMVQVAEHAPYRTAVQTYQDGSQRNLLISDVVVPYPDGRMIVSRTDVQGIILQANAAFVQISGYSREELIGAPQHILRHPDMPAVAFADMWAVISRGENWYGYVKNLRKDGAAYWVYASVVPNIRAGQIVAYTSIRRKPAQEKVVDAIALYATMR